MNKYLDAAIQDLGKGQVVKSDKIDSATVTVNESIGRAAFYYEKLRNVLDYQDERLFLKNAIKRIMLRRAFYGEKQDSASKLLRELVWAKYFENDSIPQSRVEEVAAILRKYEFIRKNASYSGKTSRLNQIIYGLAACEIEDLLASPLPRKDFIEFGKSIIEKNIQIPEDQISTTDLQNQIEIVLERSIFKSDADILRYRILRHYNKYWPEINMDEAKQFCANFESIISGIDAQINQSTNSYLSRYIKRYIPAFSILWEVISQNGQSCATIFQDEEKLNEMAKAVIDKRNKNTVKKVAKAVFRGIIFVLLTKVLLAMIIEAPYEIALNGSINYLAIGINTTLPPLIMLISGLFIKVPGRKNTSVLLKIINSAVFQNEIPLSKLHQVKKTKRKGQGIFNFFYTLVSLAILALVGWGLVALDFEIVGIFLFFLFISIVSFLGFRIRATARELEVVSNDDSTFSNILGLILLPFIVIGKFLSDKWSQYNFTLMFWDFIVEAPFKTIIGFLESWFYFLREKREDFE